MPVLKNNYQRSKNSHDGGRGRALGASAARAVPSCCGAAHRSSVPRALLKAKPSPRQSIYFILSFMRQNRRRDVSGVLKQIHAVGTNVLGMVSHSSFIKEEWELSRNPPDKGRPL